MVVLKDAPYAALLVLTKVRRSNPWFALARLGDWHDPWRRVRRAVPTGERPVQRIVSGLFDIVLAGVETGDQLDPGVRIRRGRRVVGARIATLGAAASGIRQLGDRRPVSDLVLVSRASHKRLLPQMYHPQNAL